MHLLLTDRLCCPRCGPQFGLILLADRLEDRRIHDGGLGCPNCRDSYPVRDGVGDLRAAPRVPLQAAEDPSPPLSSDGTATGAPGDAGGDGAAERPTAAEIGGLLGVLRGPGHLLVMGSLATRARALATMIEGIEVVAAGAGEPGGVEEDGVSRLIVRAALPFQSYSLRGAALIDGENGSDLAEVVRVIAPGGRLVIFDTEPEARGRISDLGLEVIAEEETRLVARR